MAGIHGLLDVPVRGAGEVDRDVADLCLDGFEAVAARTLGGLVPVPNPIGLS